MKVILFKNKKWFPFSEIKKEISNLTTPIKFIVHYKIPVDSFCDVGNKNSKICFEKDYMDKTFFKKSERKHYEDTDLSQSNEEMNRLQHNDEVKGIKLKELERAQLDVRKIMLNNLHEKQDIQVKQQLYEAKINQIIGQNNTIISKSNEETAQNNRIIIQNNNIISHTNTIIAQNNQIIAQNNTSHQKLDHVKESITHSKNEIKQHFDTRYYNLRSHHKTTMVENNKST